MPWAAAEERNIEEVFKNYRYFAIVYSQDGSHLMVTEYIQGKAKGINEYQLDASGRLVAQGESDPGDATASLYASLCAACYAADRLGGSGPALLPENLGRLKRNAAASVIRDGRVATRMPAFGKTLDEGRI